MAPLLIQLQETATNLTETSLSPIGGVSPKQSVRIQEQEEMEPETKVSVCVFLYSTQIIEFKTSIGIHAIHNG